MNPTPSDDEMVSPRAIGVALFVFLVIYQTVLMAVWITYVEYDWLLLRVSLSFSDALGIGALSLAFYTYWQMWKLKQKYGTYDFDTVEEKRRALEKAGDDLDTMEVSYQPGLEAHASKVLANGGEKEA